MPIVDLNDRDNVISIGYDQLEEEAQKIIESMKIDIESVSQPIYSALDAAREAALSKYRAEQKSQIISMPVNLFLANLLRQISGMVRASIKNLSGEQITGAAIDFATIAGSKQFFDYNAKACYEVFKEHIDNYLQGHKKYDENNELIVDEMGYPEFDLSSYSDKVISSKESVDKGEIQVERYDDGVPKTTDSGDYIIKPLGYLVEPYISEHTGEQIGLLIAWGRVGITESETDLTILYPIVKPSEAMQQLKKKYPGVYSIKYDSADAADKAKDALTAKVQISGSDPTINNLYQSISKIIKQYAERGKTGGAFAFADFAWGVQNQSQMQQIYHSYDDDNGGNAIWNELKDKGYLVDIYQSQYPPYDEYGLKIAWGANDLETDDNDEYDKISKEDAMDLLNSATPQHAVDTDEEKNIVAPRAEDLIETAFNGTEALSVTLNNLIGETIESTVISLKNNIISKDLPYVIVDTTKSTNAALSAFILGKQNYIIKHQALTLYKDETYSEESVPTYEVDTSINLPKIMDDLGYIAYLDKEKTKPIYLQMDGEDKYVIFGYFDKSAIISKLLEQYLLDNPEATQEMIEAEINKLDAENNFENLWQQFIDLILVPIQQQLQNEIDDATATQENGLTYYKAADGADVLEIDLSKYGLDDYTGKLADFGEADRLKYWEQFFKYLNKQMKKSIKKKKKQIKKAHVTAVNQTTIIKIPFKSIRKGNDAVEGVADAFSRWNVLSKDIKLLEEDGQGYYYQGEATEFGGGASIIQALSNLGWNLIWRQGWCNYTDLRSSKGRPVWDQRNGQTETEGVDAEYDYNKDIADSLSDAWKWDSEVYYKFTDNNSKREKTLDPAVEAIMKDKYAAIEAVSQGYQIDDGNTKVTFPHAPLYDVKRLTNANSGYSAFCADPHPIYSFYWTEKNKKKDLKPPAYNTSCSADILDPTKTAQDKRAKDKNFHLLKDMGQNIYGVIDPNEDPANANSAVSYFYKPKTQSSISNSATETTTDTDTETRQLAIGSTVGLMPTFVTVPYDDISSADGIIIVFSDYTSQLYPDEATLRWVMETEWEYVIDAGKEKDGYYNPKLWWGSKEQLDTALAFNSKKSSAYWSQVHSAIKNIKGQKLKPSSPNVLQTIFNNLQEQIAKAEGVKNPKKYG